MYYSSSPTSLSLFSFFRNNQSTVRKGLKDHCVQLCLSLETRKHLLLLQTKRQHTNTNRHPWMQHCNIHRHSGSCPSLRCPRGPCCPSPSGTSGGDETCGARPACHSLPQLSAHSAQSAKSWSELQLQQVENPSSNPVSLQCQSPPGHAGQIPAFMLI